MVPFSPERAEEFQRVMKPWAKGMDLTFEPTGEAVLKTPSGWMLQIGNVEEIPPDFVEGGAELLAREIRENPEFQPGPPRGAFINRPRMLPYTFTDPDGNVFDADSVVLLAGGATPDTLPFELWRVAHANLLTGKEQRAVLNSFGTLERAAMHYATMVNRRTSHPILWRLREFFERLRDWMVAPPQQREAKAIMRDVASGRMFGRPTTLEGAGPGPARRAVAPAPSPARPAAPAPAPMPVSAPTPVEEAAAAMGPPPPAAPDAWSDAEEELIRQAEAIRRGGVPAPAASPIEEAAAAMGPPDPRSIQSERFGTIEGNEDFSPEEALRLLEIMDEIRRGGAPIEEEARRIAEAEGPAPMGQPRPPAAQTVIKGRGTRESPKAPPRPAKRVSKLGAAPAAEPQPAPGARTPFYAPPQAPRAEGEPTVPRPPVSYEAMVGMAKGYPIGRTMADRARAAEEAMGVPATAAKREKEKVPISRGDEAILNTKMPRGWEIGTVEMRRREEDGSIVGKTVNARVNKAKGLAINAMPSDVTDALTYNVTDPESGMSLISAPSVGKAHAGAELIAPYRDFFHAYNKLLNESDAPSKEHPWVREFMSGFVELRRQFIRSNISDVKRISIPEEMIRGYKGAVAYLSSSSASVPAPEAPKAERAKKPAPAKAAKPIQGSLVEEPLKFKRTRRDPNAPPQSWGEVVRKIASQSNKIGLSKEVAGELHNAGFFDEFGPDSKFVKSSKAGVARMMGEAGRYFYITNPGVGTFGGPRRGGRSGKDLASGHSDLRAFIPWLEAVGARDGSGELIGDASDTPQIVEALLSSNPVVADADKFYESESYEREAYMRDVEEGFEGSIEDWRAEIARRLEPAPKIMRADVVPEMPKGPRPTSQRDFAMDMQPPTMETGRNPDADPNTPDMFGNELPFQPARRGGGQGSFGFQPAARMPDSKRVSEIQAWLKKNVPVDSPSSRWLRNGIADAIAKYEESNHPFYAFHARDMLRELFRGNPRDVPDFNAAADAVLDDFDVELIDGPDAVVNGSSVWARPDAIHFYARDFGGLSVRPVDPYYLSSDDVLFSDPHRQVREEPGGIEEFFDPDNAMAGAFHRLYRRISELSEDAAAAIRNFTGAAFQPGKREGEPQVHERRDPIAAANADDRVPKPDAVRDAGAARMLQDPRAVEAMLRKAAAENRVLSDEETVAAQMLSREISRDALNQPDGPERAAKMKRAVENWNAYAKVGSEAGRSLRARHWRSESDRIVAEMAEALFAMTKDEASRYDRASTADRAKIEAEVAARAERGIARAAKSGIDIPAAMTGIAATEKIDRWADESKAKIREAAKKFRGAATIKERAAARAAEREIDRAARDAKTIAGEAAASKRWWKRKAAELRKFIFGFQPSLANEIESAFAPALDAMSSPSGTNAVTLKRVQRIMEAERATPGDMAREYWVNSILSGPQTQIVNVFGNVAEQLWTATMRIPETALAESMRLIGMKSDGPTIRETAEFFKAIGPGIQMGLRNGLRSWRIEDAVLANEYSLGRESSQLPENARDETEEQEEQDRHPEQDEQSGRAQDERRAHAIPGRTGVVVRTPGRAMLAADEFFKGVAFRMELGAQAWKIGKAQGKTGADLRAFVAEQSVNPSEAVAQAAMKHAERVTFTQDPGKIAKEIANFRNKVPAATYIIPFVATPMNLLRTAARRTPLGTANLGYNMAKEMVARASDTPGGFRYETKYRDAVEQFVAWSALMLVAGAMGDEDDPIITGSKQFGVDKRGEIDLAYRSAPPQSIKIGGKWYSYARADPFATALTLMVDGLRAQGKTKDASEAMSRLMRSTLGIVSNATFLQGLADVLEMVTTGGDVKRWAENFATSWVPNIVRQPARAFEPNILERKGQPFGEVVKQGAFPAVRGALVPKVDLWGRDVKASSLGMGPATDIPFRILSPAKVQVEEKGPALELDRTILRYNMLHPADPWYPVAPASSFSDGRGGQIQMTPTEYHDFLKAVGQTALKRLSGMRPLPDTAEPRALANRVEIIKRTLGDAAAMERKRVLVRKRRESQGFLSQ